MSSSSLLKIPKNWDKPTCEFLVKIVSITSVPLDNSSFWLKDVMNIKNLLDKEYASTSEDSTMFLYNLCLQLSNLLKLIKS
ncbi:hypothetical protein AYI70_g11749 [Smittium culicis]|uniref:Uncharacterized protein n=1 Tax=Smittium culicis TaxID=133412 RepID=A0A1R1X0H6_9FUNG|nr:hypothetical protein AYI70_g11749 [Smittium culicis]